MKKVLLVAVIGLAVVTTLQAQPLSEKDYLTLKLSPVLTGSRLKQKRANVPASVTVIDRQMIEASGARDIPSVLRLVPGVIVGHNGDRVGVSYHGSTDYFSRRFQVLVDGRSVYTPTVGGMEWYEFPVALEDIERIEVIRGPNGATYGSNAFSAVINIITRHPSTTKGVMARVETSSGKYRRALVRYGAVNGRYAWRLTAGKYTYHGFDTEFDSQRRYLFDYRGELRLSSSDRLELSAGASGGVHGKGGGNDTDPYRYAHKMGDHQYLRWVRNLSPSEEVSLRFYHNHHRESDIYPVLIGGVLPYTFSLSMEMDRYDLELQHSKRLGRTFRMVWGAEIRRDEVDGVVDPGLFGANKIINDVHRLYINGEYTPAPAWVINAGVMYEHNDFTGADVSPRLALNYHIAKNHTLRFIHSSATRIPAALEERANAVVTITSPPLVDRRILGNSRLLPERIVSNEIGYFGRLFNGRMNVDVRVFSERIRDIIAFIDDKLNISDYNNQAQTFVNDGYSNIRGWEFHLDFRPSRDFRMLLGFSNVHTDGRVRDETSSDGSLKYVDLASTMPRRIWSLLLIRKFADSSEISANFYRYTPVEWLGGDDTGNVSVIDVRYAKRFRQGRGRGKLEFIIQNAAGRYLDYDRDYQFRPRVLVSYTYQH
jgi:iron complex outermembrane receptor protein